MPLERYPDVKIGTVYLTEDGTAGALSCKCTVEGEEAFATTLATNTVLAADATPYTQIVDRGVRGIPFAVTIEWLPLAVLAAVVVVLNAALAADVTVRVIVNSVVDFDVQAVPQVQEGGKLYTSEGRSGGYAKNVTFRFISSAPGA